MRVNRYMTADDVQRILADRGLTALGTTWEKVDHNKYELPLTNGCAACFVIKPKIYSGVYLTFKGKGDLPKQLRKEFYPMVKAYSPLLSFPGPVQDIDETETDENVDGSDSQENTDSEFVPSSPLPDLPPLPHMNKYKII